MYSILFVDDEPNITETYGTALRDEGLDVVTTNSPLRALEMLREREFDLVISDISMPEMNGVELLKKAKAFAPEIVFIMITAYASTETAIEALQHGAYDYVTKPPKIAELRSTVAEALEKRRRSREGATKEKKEQRERALSGKLSQAVFRYRLLGRSPKMTDLLHTLEVVAESDSTVLITGESGTGKEGVARALHKASPRSERPFVSVNCGAFPETLLESELFGYMKGAFTGANNNKQGLFEAARGGTIFLDEIGETTPAMQVKLLRVLQDRTLRPLGGTSEISTDVRVIAATNRDLKEAITQGLFREDFYYRIAVITLRVPPLRERPEDVELLAFHFVRLYAEKTGKRVQRISPDVLRRLERYHWPGNVRELENAIERAVTLSTSDVIEDVAVKDDATDIGTSPVKMSLRLPDAAFDFEQFITQLERYVVCEALTRCSGNQTAAADYLKLTKPSLRHKIQVLGIDAASFKRGAP